MLDFLILHAGTIIELNRLLGTRFVPGHPSNDTPLGRSVAAIFIYHNRRELAQRDFELLKLQFLVQHLKRLEQARPELLRYYRRKLREARNNDAFFGLRYEVNIASSLIKKGLTFEKTERPDFRLPDHGLSLECTSVRIRTARGKEHDLTYKVASVIRGKAKKGYATHSTALFIDITNVAHSSSSFDPEAFRAAAVECLPSTSFGAVVLMTYIMNLGLGRLESSYLRVDHPSAAPELIGFLDQYFPRGKHDIQLFSLPFEG